MLDDGGDQTNRLEGKIESASFRGGNGRFDVTVGGRAVRVVGSAETIVTSRQSVQLSVPPRSAVAAAA